MDNTLKGESTEESKEGSKDKIGEYMERKNKEKMKATKKRYLSMDVSGKSGGRLVVVEFKFVTENCAVSMTAIY